MFHGNGFGGRVFSVIIIICMYYLACVFPGGRKFHMTDSVQVKTKKGGNFCKNVYIFFFYCENVVTVRLLCFVSL